MAEFLRRLNLSDTVQNIVPNYYVIPILRDNYWEQFLQLNFKICAFDLCKYLKTMPNFNSPTFQCWHFI